MDVFRRVAALAGLSATTVQIQGQAFTLQEKIGEGGYGTLHLCADASGRQFVAKLLPAPDAEHRDAALREAAFQRDLAGCPHVVGVVASDSVGAQICIVMEHCPQSLVAEMGQAPAGGLPRDRIAKIFTSVLAAVAAMHERSPPVIHRDLKPENVIAANDVWKLCDFGSATTTVYDFADGGDARKASTDIERNTTAPYRSPEMVDFYREQVIDVKSDIWALGCLLFKMCTLKDAFPNGKLETLNGQIRWSQSWPVDDFFKRAVERCLRPNPADRPTAAALLAEFTEHFAIHDLSASSDSGPASRSSSFPTLAAFPQEFCAALLAKLPPPADCESDESDIEMDAEADGAPLPPPPQHFVSLADLEFDDELPEAALPQASDQQGVLIVIDTDEPPLPAPPTAAGIRRRVSEILDFSPLVQPSPTDDLASQMKSDTRAFGAALFALSPLALGDTLYQLVLKHSEAPQYILTVVHESGPRAPTLLLRVPPLVLNPFNDYLMQRKKFAEQYPMFEGNFSLAEFSKQNRASPPPPGTAPLDVKVVQGLQQLLDCLLIAFRREPTPLLAEEARNLYQAAAYIIAKLKLFQFKTGFLDTTTIPIARNHHLLVRKAFDQSGVKVEFPSEPFNFDDAMIQKRLRPPPSNCAYDQ